MLMTLSESIMALCIAALMAFAVYLELILPRRAGATRLRVPLRRRLKPDGPIFIVLLAIVLWNNIAHQGRELTTILLMVLGALSLWLFCLRRPLLLLKARGMWVGGAWVDYHRIQALTLSEDGILLMQLAQRSIPVAVQQPDDLERIYHVLIEAS